MKSFLKLISLFLTLKMITSFQCLENNVKNCTCFDLDNSAIEYICLYHTNNNSEYNNYEEFNIVIGPFETVIKCIKLSNLKNFHFDFRFLHIYLTTLVLENCVIDKNTDLEKIKELTSVQYVNTITLSNNIQLNNILIDNTSAELFMLSGLIIMDYNNLTEVSEKILHKVPNIVYLTIKNCFVQTITPNAFHNLKILSKLDLSKNKLKYIHPETFDYLFELTNLDLSDNEIEILDDKIFQHLQDLKNLNLQNNKITTISELLLSKLHKLEIFNANENLISTIHENAFTNLFELKQISLAKNKLNDLLSIKETEKDKFLKNNSIFASCNNLIELNLAYNNIQNFYDDWIELSEMKLTSLQLSHNLLPHFAVTQHHLKMKSDFYINLSNNMMKGINLYSLTSLEFETPYRMHINARDNPINCDCLNDRLLQYIKGNLDKKIYQHLNIDTTNLICTGPEELKGEKLSDLSSDHLSCQITVKTFNDNNVSCTPKYFLERQLTIINCPNNNYTKFPEGLGIITSFATEIELENNNLEYIPSEFSKAEQKTITKLNLSGNKIKSLNGIHLFENLEILELKNNNIRNVRNKYLLIFGYLKSLKSITLSGNPLICGPNFEKLKNYIKIKDRNNLTCRDEPLIPSEKSEPIFEEPKETYSLFAKYALCSLEREDVEKTWQKQCSIPQIDETKE
ncbi:protein toll-like [Leptopilina boulardi]|uniref:protein toll-like n=1 Tax=Leptopilina boulardi TaxID=63433 RepID=UPI0021F5491C|nr:protein toll-like [Leptopilina boulardi]